MQQTSQFRSRIKVAQRLAPSSAMLPRVAADGRACTCRVALSPRADASAAICADGSRCAQRQWTPRETPWSERYGAALQREQCRSRVPDSLVVGSGLLDVQRRRRDHVLRRRRDAHVDCVSRRRVRLGVTVAHTFARDAERRRAGLRLQQRRLARPGARTHSGRLREVAVGCGSQCRGTGREGPRGHSPESAFALRPAHDAARPLHGNAGAGGAGRLQARPRR